MSCGVGRRCGSDLTLLWLWCSSAAAALIRHLAWEPPYAMGVALEKVERQKKTKKKGIDFIISYVTSQLKKPGKVEQIEQIKRKRKEMIKKEIN